MGKITLKIMLVLLCVYLSTFPKRVYCQESDLDFTHLIDDVPLFSEYTVDVSEKFSNDPEAWEKMKTALPNLKKLFFSSDPYFSVLIGWGKSLDNFEKYTKKQIKQHFTSLVRTYQSEKKLKGGNYSLEFSDDDPLTMKMTGNYFDGGHPYRDVVYDIVATPYYIVSIRISARTDTLGEEYWPAFNEQIELVRQKIRETYGIVSFSDEGHIIWWSLVLNDLFWFLIISISAFSISRLYIRKISFSPGSTARKYSAFIMIMITIMIIGNLIVNTGTGYSDFARLEYIPHMILVFIVHLLAYITQKPKIVSFAIWLVAAIIFATFVSRMLGYISYTKSNIIGSIIGASIVIYVLYRSTSSLQTEDNVEAEIVNINLKCDYCDFESKLEDFNSIELFCPKCGVRLTKTKI